MNGVGTLDAVNPVAHGPLELKPRLRGVSHQYAFYVSVAFGAALVLAAPGSRATIAGRDLRGQRRRAVRRQRALSPDHLGARVGPADGCAGSTTR